jgi:hypothetical protein
MKKQILSLALVLFALASGPTLSAQNIKGALSGTVTDQTGAKISGAKLRILDSTRGLQRQLETGSDGDFFVPGLDAGNYRVEVQAAGFQNFELAAVEVTTGRQPSLKITLNVQGISSEISVQASTSRLQQEDAKVSETITAEQLNDLPVRAGGQGRNYYSQVLVLPGVAGTTAAHQPFSISGNRSRSNNYLVDSVDSTDSSTGLVSGRGATEQLISQEALQSVEVLTHNFKAEYGRNSGGVVSLITKSGSNDFHGSAYWYHNNSEFSARNFFDSTVPKERTNLPGFTLGGPVVKNRAFFFANYEKFLVRGTGRSTFQGLTAAEKASAVPSVQALTALYPTAPSAAQRTFTIGTPNTIDLNTYLFRGDFILTPKQVLMARVSNTKSDLLYQSTGSILGSSTDGIRQTLGATLQHSSTLRANLFNELRLGFNRQVALDNENPNPTFLGNPAINGNIGSLRVTGLPALGIPTFLNSYNFQNNYQLMNDLTWNRGRHTLKFGTSIRRIHVNDGSVTSAFRGTLTFNSLALFLAGTPNTYSIIEGNPRIGLRRTEFQNYIQDDFKLSQRLTLNLGLRWELNTSPTEVANRIPSSSLLKTDRNNFAPRFGAAYRVNDKTILRAGYGIYFNVLETTFIGLTRFNPPLLRTFDAVNPTFPNLSAQAQSGLPSGLVRPNQNSATPYAQHLNFAVERQITNGSTLSASYVGTLSRKLSRTRRPNGGEQLAQPLRPDTSVGVLNILETSANSDYQSLQLSYSGKIGKDLTLRASYTYSKFLDDISDIAGTNTNVDRTVLALDESRLFLDRGLSNLHIGQVLSFTYLYRLPFFKSNRYLGGWTISGMQSAQSGRPFTIYTGTNTPIGSNNQRPLATPGSLLFSPSSQTAIQYGAGFNATLLRPGALDFGTLGRNTGQTDSFLNLSASLQKDFRILEGVSAQMRAEVYNLTNTTNFLTIDSVMSSANFGRYTVAGDSRRIQFALRFVF